MSAEMCIAHELGCPVHIGEFVRINQLRPGASYVMLITRCEYFNTMSKRTKSEIKQFGWDVSQCEDEWFIRGRWASIVGSLDGVFTARSVARSACRLDELVLRTDEALWPAREIVAVLDVVHADDYKEGHLDGIRDAYESVTGREGSAAGLCRCHGAL